MTTANTTIVSNSPAFETGDINLSLEEEKEISSVVSNTSAASKDMTRLFSEYHKTKDKKLRARLTLMNQPLVPFILNKYYGVRTKDKVLREDLLQEGMIGLINAIDGFNPDLGYKFSTYSCWWIRQAVNNYLSNVEPSIRVPGHVRSAYNKLSKQLKSENKDIVVEIKNSISTNDKSKFDGFNEKMIENIHYAMNSRFVNSVGDLGETSTSNNPSGSMSAGGSGGRTGIYNGLTSQDYCNEVMFSDSSGNSGDNFCPIEQKFDEKNVGAFLKKAFDALSTKDKLLILLRFDLVEENQIGQLINIWAKKEE